MEGWQDFGQKVDLTARIREILLNYPEGTSILKELLQNADDARATKVKFCLDHRRFPTGSLVAPSLAPFQGEALYVYNNSVFSEADFQSISRIGDSLKRNEVGKTGRFGVGFNSCYHLTDVPSFVSGTSLVMFDPHCKYLPNISAHNPGKKLNFMERDMVASLPDQMRPYQVFGCDMNSSFKGTFFRFPLRTAQMAAASSLSKQVYTPEKILDLLHQLQQEAPLIMLFLKSVCEIEVLDWASGADEPSLLFTCRVSNASPSLLRDRALFLQASSAQHRVDPAPLAAVYQLNLELRSHINDQVRMVKFLISQLKGGGRAASLAEQLSIQFGMPLTPWGAVALPLPLPEQQEEFAGLHQGKAFCFLPLPSNTGLPVHVNAYFELSSNRRDIWHGVDMSGTGALRAAWNHMLLADVVAPAYAAALTHAAQLLGATPEYFRLWPTVELQAPWQQILPALYTQLSTKPVVWTEAGQGCWLSPVDAQYAGQDVLGNADLKTALLGLGLPLCCMPESIVHALNLNLPQQLLAVTPPAVRKAVADRPRAIDHMAREAAVPALLQYCMSDCPAGAPHELAKSLNGLRLLPMLDGTTVWYRDRTGTEGPGAALAGGGLQSVASIHYVVTELERCILSSQGSLLVDSSLLGSELTSRLQPLASSALLNIAPMEPQAMTSIMLPRILPCHWSTQPINTLPDAHPVLTTSWVQQLWKWLATVPSLAPFVNWTILPLHGGQFCRLEPLQSSVVVMDCPSSGTGREPSSVLSPDLRSVLLKLGCRIADVAGFNLPVNKLGSYVHPCTGPGVAAAVLVAVRQRIAPGSQVAAAMQSHGSQGPGSIFAAMAKTAQQLGSMAAAAMEGAGGDKPMEGRVLESKDGSNGSSNRTVVSESVPPLLEEIVGQLGQGERQLLRRFLLQDGWFCQLRAGFSAVVGRSGMTDELYARLLSAMPIYEAVHSSRQSEQDGKEREPQQDGMVHFVTLKPQRFLYKPGVDPRVLGPEFLSVADEAEARLLVQFLRVRDPTMCEVYRWHVLPALPQLKPGIRDEAMLSMLRQLPQLMQQDSGFVSFVKQVPCIVNGRGELHRPCKLYDPRNSDLSALLDPTSSFPATLFSQDPLALSMLQQLGMRSSASLETILDSARFVQQESTVDEDMAMARGHALLSYLEVEANRLLGAAALPGTRAFGGLLNRLNELVNSQASIPAAMQSFWADLARLQWCPVLFEPPVPGLPWPAKSERLAAPRFVRPLADMWLASSCMSILDGECRSSVLATGLGWTQQLPGSVLAQQLIQLGSLHSTVQNPDVAKVLATVVPQLYSTLSSLPEDELQVVHALLEEARCVWVGNGFAPAARVAFTGALDLSPWMYVLPIELSPFRELLLQLGVKQAFSAEQFVTLLGDMARESGGNAMEPTQLSQAIAVVQALADLSFNQSGSTLFAPDTAGVLRPVVEMAYNDAPWLAEQPAACLVHPKISNHVADRVGVSSLRRQLLAQSADSMSLGLHSVEVFGQSEALTVRLRHIIEDYPEGPSVLLELLQNADDAGARRVAFLLDTTSYPTSSILAPSMATWQGPALLAFNDAMFSPSDFRNISRIGQDSKLAKPASIGRFGLGFNAVYHFTDVPSFVSGDHLVMFDPHAKYLPGINAAQPGLKIAFQRANLLAQFPDAFTPFLQFGCSLREHFSGTLFRFPLRSESAAAGSDIKQIPCREGDVLGLFHALRQQLPDAMLFLKSVQELSVYIKSQSDLEPQLLYQVSLSARLDEASQQQHLQFTRHHSASHPGAGAAAAASQPSIQTPIAQFVTGLGGQQDVQTVLHRLAGVKQVPMACGQVRTHITDCSLGVDARHYIQMWMVCNSLAAGRCLEVAVHALKSHSTKMIPWVGVAVRLPAAGVGPESTPTSLDRQLPDISESGVALGKSGSGAGSGGITEALCGRVFCFLPLPAVSGLPAHVNGYFELSSNRRDIWHGADMSGHGALRASWNNTLLMEAVAPAYLTLLTRLAQVMGPSEYFFSLFPSTSVQAPWSQVTHAFYQRLASAPLLWTPANGGRWVPPSQGVVPTPSTPHKTPKPPQGTTPPPSPSPSPLIPLLVDLGLPVVQHLPPAVEACVLSITPGALSLSPGRVRKHLSLVTANSHALLQQPVEQGGLLAAAVLLEYCLEDVDYQQGAYLQQLEGLSLLPLASGGLGTLRVNQGGSGTRMYLQPQGQVEQQLLEGPKHLVVHPAVSPALQQQLHVMAKAGAMNVIPLTMSSMCSLVLPVVLPASWRGSSQVDWSRPGEEGQPSREWVRLLWLWAAERKDVDALKDWPVLPLKGGQLHAPLLPTKVVRDGGWTEQLSSALARLGCGMLDSSLLDFPCPALDSFVQPATAVGMLRAIAAAQGNTVAGMGGSTEGGESSLSEEERRHLCMYLLQARWFKSGEGAGTMSEEDVSLLKQLPIFQVHRASSSSIHTAASPPTCVTSGTAAHGNFLNGQAQAPLHPTGSSWVSLSEPLFLAPVGVDARLLTERFLKVCSEVEERVLQQHLGVKRLAMADFLQSHVLPYIGTVSADVMDATLRTLLVNMRGLVQQEAGLVQALRDMALVPCLDGQRRTPSQLFDPRNTQLCALLDSASHFPAPPFGQDPLLLDRLGELGLSTALTIQVLLASAKSLDTAAAAELEAQRVVLPRAKQLLAAIDEVAMMPAWQRPPGTCNEAAWKQLTSISWCPVMEKPEFEGLPNWSGTTPVLLAPPRLVRPQRWAPLCSAALHMLDGECSNRLEEEMEWGCSPPASVLTTQLLELSAMHRQVADEPLCSRLEVIVDQLYCLLDEALAGPEASLVQAALDTRPCVWVGNGFAPPQAVALSADPSLRPYLHGLPEAVAKRKCVRLLECLKVADAFGPAHYVHGLQALTKVSEGRALEERELAVALVMVERLVNVQQEQGKCSDQLLLPDENGIMSLASQLYYNDAVWLDSSSLHLVHPDVPQAWAAALGLRSVMYHHAVDSQMTSELPCAPAEALSQLLSAQALGPGSAILDVLEVADCLQCPQVDIILDLRQHPTQSLLGPGLTHFQGPALCFVLQETTLAASELCELMLPPAHFGLREQVVMFGTGLMGVFTLTDLPQVISGNSAYMWDPSGQYLGHTAADLQSGRPRGKQYQNVDSELLARFEDQFKVWDFADPRRLSSTPLEGAANKTLIRLPLRTPPQAARSPICSRPTPLSLQSLLCGELRDGCSHSLLFLRHLVTVAVHRCSAGAQAASQLWQTSLGNPTSCRVGMELPVIRKRGLTRALKLPQVGPLFRSQRTNLKKIVPMTLAMRTGEGKDAEVEHRSYLVSIYQEELSARLEGKGLDMMPSSAFGAVACRYEKSRHSTELLPVSGLFSPLALIPSLVSDPAPEKYLGPSFLSQQPFLVCGHFILLRSHGRQIFPTFTAESATSHASELPSANTPVSQESLSIRRDSLSSTSAPSASGWGWPRAASCAPDMGATSNIVQRSQHNAQVLRSIGIAWQELFMECRTVVTNPYGLMPVLSGAVEKKDMVTEQCVAGMYQSLRRQPVWRLTATSNWVTLTEGYFLPPESLSLGEDARHYMQRHLPLLDVPWNVKRELNAAGVTETREATPSSTRRLLSKAPRGHDGRFVMGVEEAAQLLEFCCGDVEEDVGEDTPSWLVDIPPTPASPITGDAAAGLAGLAAALATPNSDLHPSLNMAAANIAGIVNSMRAAIGMDVTEPSTSQQDGVQGSAGDATGRGAQARERGEGGARQRRAIKGKLVEFPGLPIPTASGRVLPIAHRGSLFVWPIPAGSQSPSPVDILPPHLHIHFVHPSMVQRLQHLFKQESVRKAWGLQAYTFAVAAKHLGQLVAPAQPRANFIMAEPAPPSVRKQPWDDTKPTLTWLQQLWQMLLALDTGLQEWGEANSWDHLDDFPVLPVAPNHLTCVRHRQLLWSPPPSALPLDQQQDVGETGDRREEAGGQGVGGSSGTGRLDVGENLGLLGLNGPGGETTEGGAGLDGHNAGSAGMMDSGDGLEACEGQGEVHKAINGIVSQPSGIPSTASHIVPGVASSTTSHPPSSTPITSSYQFDKLSPPWNLLLPLMDAAGCFLLHPAFDVVRPLTQPVAGSPDLVPLVQKLRSCTAEQHLDVNYLPLELCNLLFSMLCKDTPRELSTCDIEWLCSLPMFAVVSGHPGTAGPSCLGVLTDAVHKQLPGIADALPEQVRQHLLAHRPEAHNLYVLLNLEMLTVPKFIALCVLPHWGVLPEKHRMLALTYVQSEWGSLGQDAQVRGALARLAFVATADGSLKAPQELYDPNNMLFIKVFQREPLFPVDQFAFPAWQRVLRDCGMRHTVTPPIFLQCARHLEAKWAAPPSGGEPDPSVLQAAQALVDHLLQNYSSLLGREFLQELGEVAFVPGLRGMPKGAGAKPVLSSYCDCSLFKDWPLSWTAQPCISPKCQPPAAIAASLKLRSPPPFSVVVRHLHNVGADAGEEVLGSWPAAAGSIEACFERVLEYLHREGLSPAQREQLLGARFIPVANGTALVSPSHLFARLKEDLAPFAYELPSAYTRYMDLLTELGAGIEPSPSHLISSLQHFHSQHGPVPLNINQCCAVIRLLQYLSTRATSHDISFLIHRHPATGGCLLALTADARLHPARSVVWVPPGGSPLLGRVDPSVLTLAHPQLPPSVCQWLDCPTIHEACIEELDASRPFTLLDSLQGVKLKSIQRLLTTRQFVAALCSIVASYAVSVAPLRDETQLTVEAKLQEAAERLRFVESIHTLVLLRNGRMNVVRGEGSDQVYEFIDRQSGLIYVASPPKGVPVSALLAQCVSRALGSPLTLPLHPLFDMNGEDMQAHQTAVITGGYDEALDRAGQAGQLGCSLLPSDAALLQLRPLRRYQKGELIAYPRGSPSGGPAPIAGHTAISGSSQLCYGRVATNCAPPEGQTVYKVRVEVKPNMFEHFLSTQVYCFRSAGSATKGAGRTSEVGDSGSAAIAPPQEGDPSSTTAPSSNGSASGSTSQPISGEGATVQGQGAEAARRRLLEETSAEQAVSPAEVASAVRDLLAAAQLPLDLQREKLVQTCVTLQAQLSEQQKRALELERNLSIQQAESEITKQAWQCKVCFGRDVDSAFTGCGHMFCGTCIRTVQGRCPACRKASNTVRLFK